MNKKRGLTDEEVIKSRKEHGSNIITNKKRNSFIKLFIETLGDPIIRILIIALGIKLVFLMQDFDWYETVGIVIAIFLASFISTISEYASFMISVFVANTSVSYPFKQYSVLFLVKQAYAADIFPSSSINILSQLTIVDNL